jgi:hypothetical protein
MPTTQPDPPDALPNYLAEGLPKQDLETLRATSTYLEDLVAYRTTRIQDEELPTDAEPVVDADEEPGTVVKERVTCGDESCHCMTGEEKHGPYLYRYFREGGQLKSEYLGKP